MFDAIMDFATQLSLLYLLTTALVLTLLLSDAVRARRRHEALDRAEAERRRIEARRERRKIGDRPAIPARMLRPAATLAAVPIHRRPARRGFGRRLAA